MSDSRSRPVAGRRSLMLLAAAASGLFAVAGVVHAAPPSGTFTAPSATPPPPTPSPAPAIVAPKGSGESKARMWAVSLSSMVVYENGSGYLYGFWRQYGEATEKPARLYWGRPSSSAPGGCPDISDRVYHVLQAAYTQQQSFFLIVDRDPDPRQPGAYCVRGVELEARGGGPSVPLAPIAAPTPKPPAASPAK